MAKLILDTSTWLDLTKPRFEELLVELESQIKDKITVLLTCDIIIEEWQRNKERVLQDAVDSVRSHAKSALKMAYLLPDLERTELERILSKYSSIEKEQEKLAGVFFARVEKIIKRSEVYIVEDNLKIEMANRALAKQAPFHNSKNNMADALLYFGAVEHVKKTAEIATDLIFVTSNYREFSDPSDLTKLHPDLLRGDVHFYNNLAQALKMRKEMIDLMDEYQESKFWEHIENQVAIARGK